MKTEIIKERQAISDKLQGLTENFGTPDYIDDKHRFEWETDEEQVALRMPYDVIVGVDGEPDWDRQFHYIVCIIRSSMASVGLFHGNDCLSHKVFTAYMVRKKQGKSQIKHLKTKGKSRAGSRIRLASGVEFFEGINGRLQKHFDDYPIERIAFSCSKILLPHFYGSKVETPFDKKDQRILGIPRHIEKPTHEEMMRTHRFLNFAELTIQPIHL